MALDSTTDHIGIKREVWDGGTYFIDYYNTADSSAPHDFAVQKIEILQPLQITDSLTATPSGFIVGDVNYIGGDVSNVEATVDNWTTSFSVSGNTFTIFPVDAGTYTLKVRDSADTSIESETTVEVRYQFQGNVKWQAFFDDETTGDEWRLYIYKKGYTGSATDLCLSGESPVVLEHPGDSDNKFKTIKGSRLVIKAITDDTDPLTEIATADEGDYFVKLLNWSYLETWFYGYLLTDHYSEPYTQVKYEVTLTAVDGLGLLKNRDWASRTGDLFNHPSITLTDVMRLMMQEMGFNSSTTQCTPSVYCPLYPNGKSISTTPTTDQIYIDAASLYDGDEIPSFYEVVERVFSSLGLRVFFQGARLYFMYIQRYISSVQVHNGNSSFAFSGTSGLTCRLDAGAIGTEDVYYVNRDMLLEFQPSANKTVVTYDPAVDTELCPVPSFNADSFPSETDLVEPTDWAIEPSVTTSGRIKPYSYGQSTQTETPGLVMSAQNDPVSGWNAWDYYKSIPFNIGITSTASGRVKFEMKYKWRVVSGLSSLPNSTNDVDIWVAVLCAGHYLNKDGSWTLMTIDGTGSQDNVDDITIQLTDSMNSEDVLTSSFSVVSDEIPWEEQEDPTVQVRIWMPIFRTGVLHQVVIESVTCDFIPGDEAYNLLETTTTENDGARQRTEELELHYGYTNDVHTQYANKEQFLDSSGNPIETWNQTSQTGDFSLMNVMATRFNEEYRTPKKILSGSLYGTVRFYNQLNIDSTTYCIESLSFDVLKRINRVRLVQLSSTLAWPT